MASGHTLPQPLKRAWKQLVFLCGDHITSSCPVTVSLSCSLCPFDLLKMSFSILLMNMKLNLGSKSGEARDGAGMCCLRPWLGSIPVIERQLWPMAFGEAAPGKDLLRSSGRAGHQAALWRLAAGPGNWEGGEELRGLRGDFYHPLCPSTDNAPHASLSLPFFSSDDSVMRQRALGRVRLCIRWTISVRQIDSEANWRALAPSWVQTSTLDD